MEVKVGDTVECLEYDGYYRNGVVMKMHDDSKIEIKKPDGGTWYIRNGNGNYKVISSKDNNMNLKEKMALVFKGEPEKSFIKAGIMNTDETLTPDGQAIFLAWLLKNNGAAFKTEVVDPILAEKDDK